MMEKLLLLRVNQKSFLLVFLTTSENSEVENNPRVSVRSECINSRPNTLINNVTIVINNNVKNSSILDSAIEGQGGTLCLAVPCNQTVITITF